MLEPGLLAAVPPRRPVRRRPAGARSQLIKELGFNAARVHQKIEDPRFLFWADRLGLLVWGETPSAFEFSPAAVNRMVAEWTEVVDRDLSHPCIVTWVPLNESWGVQHIAHNPASATTRGRCTT